MMNENSGHELNDLLKTISTSLSLTSSSSLPNSAPSTPNGLSLLDLKNNILLSYLQNLSLLFLQKLNHETLSLQPSSTQNTIWNLIQDRVHLEKGVLPLETKIGYQIRKLLRAAEDTQINTDANLRFKPNPSALVAETPADNEKGVYVPPRISSTMLQTQEREGPRRNKVLEEFISTSALSSAPTPIPSVGTNVAGIGARNTYKTSRNRDIEEYEEENFIRLPANIGKEKGKKKRERGMEGFGGEDWSGLERIGRGKWDFGRKEGKVERSRKRGFEDSGGGEEVSGRAFEKRKKTLQNMKMRKQKGKK